MKRTLIINLRIFFYPKIIISRKTDQKINKEEVFKCVEKSSKTC